MSDTRLGRKFSDLMEENKIDFNDNEEVLEVEISEIRPNPEQPRTYFDEKKLIELANSIKEHGIFQPVILKPSAKGYTLVAGERRVKAAKMAGL
ncbi:MAG: ParB/RepB/Spo0J family partition protein [Candidatus Izimaplasma sp.]|nr:ParB/RepB/Spo0J family partition protein [Candidatus Izimaplasma bacterium]